MTGKERYVLTGGPGSGKTTVLHLLEVRGYACVPEVARKVIQTRISQGLAPRPDAAEFGREILAADMAQYDSCSDNGRPTFFDRGIGDALGMLYECGATDIHTAEEYLRIRPYNRTVFLFSPWEAMYSTDAERDQTFSDSVAIAERLETWYGRLGYSTVRVPLGSPGERLDFILDTIRAARQADASKHDVPGAS